VVTHKVFHTIKWIAARKKHLAKEKEFTHLRDQLSRERREASVGAGRQGLHLRRRERKPPGDLFAGAASLSFITPCSILKRHGPQTTYTLELCASGPSRYYVAMWSCGT